MFIYHKVKLIYFSCIYLVLLVHLHDHDAKYNMSMFVPIEKIHILQNAQHETIKIKNHCKNTTHL